MKNIYLLPTNKPSRLVFDTVDKKLYYSDMLFKKTVNVLPQHLYITSGEEIKEGDWCIDDKQNIAKADKNFIFNCSHEFTKFWSKIILTNDLQLIKDGIQAIDDEFLEWFVKNPNCEEVEVENLGPGFPAGIYFINYLPEHFTQETTISIEEPKQETLEEAAKRIYPEIKHIINDVNTIREIFKNSAKWQAERMYTKEEMLKVFNMAREVYSIDGNMYLDNDTIKSNLDGFKMRYTFDQILKQLKK